MKDRLFTTRDAYYLHPDPAKRFKVPNLILPCNQRVPAGSKIPVIYPSARLPDPANAVSKPSQKQSK